MEIAGRSFLVVGASSGIGEAVARRLAAGGARVGLVARRGARLEALAAALRAGGAEAAVAAADTTDPAGVAAALADLGGPAAWDGLFFFAGQGYVAFPRELTAAEARGQLEVNFLGMLHWVERLLPAWIARGEGAIVGCAALCAYRGLPTGGPYAGSKAALKGYLESLAIDLEPYGLEVMTVLPGFVESAMTRRNNFTQPLMVSAEAAAEAVVRGLEAGHGRVEVGAGMAAVMRLLRVLPERAYRAVFRDFSRRRYACEETLRRLPPLTDPRDGTPLSFDRFSTFRGAAGRPVLKFWRDSFEVLAVPPGAGDAGGAAGESGGGAAGEPAGGAVRESVGGAAAGGPAEDSARDPGDRARRRLTAAYRIYAKTYPVTAYLAMRLVWRGRLPPLVAHYRETLRAAAAADRPLVDVAIGDGALTRLALRGLARPPTLVGVDLSPDMTRRAARRLRGLPRKLFLVTDVTETPLPDGSLSHVGLYGGFHVFTEPERAMARVARLLAPGGRVSGSILLRPRGDWAAAAARRFIDWGQLSNAMTEPEVEAVFAAAGLRFTDRRRNGDMLLFRATR